MKVKGLQLLKKYNNPSVVCLVCHTQMMKWIWETKMTKKSKWLVTKLSEHKPQEHSQPNRISFSY